MRKALLVVLLCVTCSAQVNLQTLLTIPKLPADQFDCSIDFINVVGSNSITINSVTAVNQQNNADATSLIIASVPSPSVLRNTVATFRVKSGVSGQRYIVKVIVANVSTGEIFDGQMTIAVQ